MPLDAESPAARAYEKAIRLLRVRARSTAELRSRLRALKLGDEPVEEALGKLLRQGLVDDTRFAQDRARELGLAKGWGPRKIRWDLARKGIPSPLVEQALEQAYEGRPPSERMRELALKRFGPGLLRSGCDPRTRAKAQRFLLARGFEPDEVLMLLSACDESA